jgi:hypothetical protein
VERVLCKLDREGRASAYRTEKKTSQLVRVNMSVKGPVFNLPKDIVWFLHRAAAQLGEGDADEFLVQLRQLGASVPASTFESMSAAQHAEARQLIAQLSDRCFAALVDKAKL